MNRRTKIVATIGPASQSAECIEKLIVQGVNVFRLNFSHGSHEQHRENVRNIRAIAEKLGRNTAILGDLQGPKIRLSDLPHGPVDAKEGQLIVLSIDPAKANDVGIIPVSYKPLPQSVVVGDTLLIDDGFIRVVVTKVDGMEVHCNVVQGGVLKSRKGLNRLGGGLSAPAITEKDHIDIDVAVDLQLDYLAVSFPSKASDLDPVKEQLSAAGVRIPIIAKIERAEAVANDEVLQEIIRASDGVMVARGDLGVEIGDPQLIGMQKKIIRLARRNNRPVITATQMMESMVHSPVPTRAEVFDVANAVLDGTDAVMLSAETASGDFPVKVVEAMANACVGAEQHPDIRSSSYRIDRGFVRIDETIAMAAMYAANHLDEIAAIVCLTESGNSALLMSRLSSGLPIYAISRHQSACRRMALYRGVKPIFFDVSEHGDPFIAAMNLIEERAELNAGDRLAITCGDIKGAGGMTNTLKILQLD